MVMMAIIDSRSRRTGMNGDSSQPADAAKVRSVAFALFSYLMASPNDFPFAERTLSPEDVAVMLSDVQRALPY
ncbi:MAG: hypothetical protein D6723_15670, partial [Acidobacteria bacterium]